MEMHLSSELKNKISGFAYYQIIGGILGIGITIYLMVISGAVTGLSLLFFLLSGSLFSFSIYCGHQIIKGKIQRAINLSMLNNALQIISFTMFGFAFNYISGLGLMIGIDLTKSLQFTFNLSFSSIEFKINSDQDVHLININLLAIYVLHLLSNIQKQIIIEQGQYESLQHSASDSETMTKSK